MIGTLADFRAHQAARGFPGAAASSDADATAALVRGSDYVTTEFDLTVDDTDDRVVSAAYVAAGFELAANGDLIDAPGFWITQETGKALTEASGVGWTLTDGRKVSDGVSPSDMVKNALRGAYRASGTLLRA